MSKNLTLSRVVAELRMSFKLALPLIASKVVYGLSGFLATAMISHLSKEELAAHSLVWNGYLTVTEFFVGIFFSVSIMVSQSFGAKDNNSVKVCFVHGILLAIVSAPIMMLIIWFFPAILDWTKQDPVIVELAREPFRALMWSILPLNMMIVVHHFLIGINKANLVTIMSVLIVPIEVFCFYAFLFGRWGFPNLGLAGVGYGLAISYSVSTIPVLAYLFYSEKFKIYNLSKEWWANISANLKVSFELLRLGLPLGLIFLFEAALLAVVAIMMGRLGVNALAAYQISYQYLMIALVILFALIQAITVRVGVEVGKNNRRSLRVAAMMNFIIGFALLSGFSLAYIYFPEFAIGLTFDIDSPQTRELVNETSSFLSVIGILILINCIRLISTGALRGLKDTTMPAIINFIGFWCIAFPAAYLFGFEFGLGGVGIWWGLVIGVSFSAIVLFFRFNRMSSHINLEGLVTKADRVKH